MQKALIATSLSLLLIGCGGGSTEYEYVEDTPPVEEPSEPITEEPVDETPDETPNECVNCPDGTSDVIPIGLIEYPHGEPEYPDGTAPIEDDLDWDTDYELPTGDSEVVPIGVIIPDDEYPEYPDGTAPIEEPIELIDYELPDGTSELVDVGIIEDEILDNDYSWVLVDTEGNLERYHCRTSTNTTCAMPIDGVAYEMHTEFAAGVVGQSEEYRYHRWDYFPKTTDSHNESTLMNYFAYRTEPSMFYVRTVTSEDATYKVTMQVDTSGYVQLEMHGDYSVYCEGHSDASIPCDNGNMLMPETFTPFFDKETVFNSNVAKAFAMAIY